MDLKELQKEINLNLSYNVRCNKIQLIDRKYSVKAIKIKKHHKPNCDDSIIFPKCHIDKILKSIIESNNNRVVNKYLK